MLVGVSVLQHHGVVVMLRLHIVGVDGAKLPEETGEHSAHSMKESLLVPSPRQAISGRALKYGLIEKRTESYRITTRILRSTDGCHEARKQTYG